MADQYTHTLSNCNFLFFLLLLLVIILPLSSLSPSSSSSSSHDHHQLIKPNIAPSGSSLPSYYSQYQVYCFKNSTVFFLNKKGFKKNKKGLMKSKRKKIKNSSISSSTRPFSAMLPKGFVPPSGSSPCHNLHPNSVTFFCDLSRKRP